MAKILLHFRGRLPYDEIERLEIRIKKELDENGFAIVDDNFDIYEIESDDENSKKRVE